MKALLLVLGMFVQAPTVVQPGDLAILTLPEKPTQAVWYSTDKTIKTYVDSNQSVMVFTSLTPGIYTVNSVYIAGGQLKQVAFQVVVGLPDPPKPPDPPAPKPDPTFKGEFGVDATLYAFCKANKVDPALADFVASKLREIAGDKAKYKMAAHDDIQGMVDALVAKTKPNEKSKPIVSEILQEWSGVYQENLLIDKAGFEDAEVTAKLLLEFATGLDAIGGK